jgi:YD repeat-containing protein
VPGLFRAYRAGNVTLVTDARSGHTQYQYDGLNRRVQTTVAMGAVTQVHYDLDGNVDLFLANGHPDDMIDKYSQMVRYREPLLLFHQENGKFRNVSVDAGPVFQKMFPARGLAIGDFHNDGRIGVLIGNNGGPPVLLRNNASEGNHWLGLKLEGTKCNRDAIGAKITWSVKGVTRSRLK